MLCGNRNTHSIDEIVYTLARKEKVEIWLLVNHSEEVTDKIWSDCRGFSAHLVENLVADVALKERLLLL